tara:strand:+ start:7739 stop:8686 length:948 start_codon:yes stop_codon:yes gene_type:complete
MEDFSEIWAEFEESKKQFTTVSTPKNESTDIYACKCGGQKCFQHGELPVCTSCGLTDSLYIDDTPEWTNGVSEDGKSTDMSRAGNLGVDHDLYSDTWGRGTVIRARWTDKPEMRRMARINFYQAMNSKDRRLHKAYVRIDQNYLELPSTVMKRAKQFYKEFVEGPHLTRGKNREGIMAICVYSACKEAKIPRTIDEVANAYGIDRKYMSRMDDLFREVVEIERDVVQDGEAGAVAHRLMIPFQLPGKQRMQVVKACNKLEECSKLMSRHPKTIAAAALMVVMDIPKAEIVAKTGVSASSISKLEHIVRDYLTTNM